MIPAHICRWLTGRSGVRSRSGTASPMVTALLTSTQRVAASWLTLVLHFACVYTRSRRFYYSIGQFCNSIECYVLLSRSARRSNLSVPARLAIFHSKDAPRVVRAVKGPLLEGAFRNFEVWPGIVLCQQMALVGTLGSLDSVTWASMENYPKNLKI